MSTNQFVVIASPRTKSSYLINLLNSHPDIHCHSEYFHQDKAMLNLAQTPTNAELFDCQWRDANPLHFMQCVYEETEQQFIRSTTIGGKLLLYAYQMNHGLDAILALKPKIIFLHRENRLAWYSSLKIAIQTNVWALNKPRLLQPQIEFNIKEYTAFVENQILMENIARKVLQEGKHDMVSIEYAEIDQPDTLATLLTFLGLPIVPLSANSVTQNSTNILTRFTNPHVVKTFAASIGKMQWISENTL